MNLTLEKYIAGVAAGELDPQEVAQDYFARAQNDTYNAYVHLHPEYVEQHVTNFAERPLRSAPIAIKDIILTQDYETTIGSNIMKGYIPPYSATCFRKLEEA
jgi:aspartyl-tRNA(Asn)/glutamyl-tRNA(Gln) amidotransferase subunit A